MKGLIHIYEGDGKGKTTSAVGLSIRCVGNGGNVLFTQFLKDGTSSELKILREIEGMDVFSAEKQFGFTFQMTKQEKLEASEYYKEYFDKITKKLHEKKYTLLVLDELMAAYNTNLLDKGKVLEFLSQKPEELEVVLTGRNPAKELILLADYHSEIKKVKHPFDQGVHAREGIEL